MKYLIESPEDKTHGELNEWFTEELLITDLNKDNIVIDDELKIRLASLEIERILDENIGPEAYEIFDDCTIELKVTGNNLNFSEQEIQTRFEDYYDSTLFGLVMENSNIPKVKVIKYKDGENSIKVESNFISHYENGTVKTLNLKDFDKNLGQKLTEEEVKKVKEDIRLKENELLVGTYRNGHNPNLIYQLNKTLINKGYLRNPNWYSLLDFVIGSYFDDKEIKGLTDFIEENC